MQTKNAMRVQFSFQFHVFHTKRMNIFVHEKCGNVRTANIVFILSFYLISVLDDQNMRKKKKHIWLDAREAKTAFGPNKHQSLVILDSENQIRWVNNWTETWWTTHSLLWLVIKLFTVLFIIRFIVLNIKLFCLEIIV